MNAICILILSALSNESDPVIGSKMICNDKYSCSLPDDADRDYFTLERKIGYID